MSFPPFISLQNVTKQYPAERFSGVRDVMLTIEKGKIVSIVGESGSGKSTLLKLIYGLISPDAGAINFRGEQILGPAEKLIPGHDSMKMVTQAFDLNTFAKVYDNVAGMLPNTNLKYKKEKAEEILGLLNIRDLANKRVIDLSGGEQQRVAIARAIITEPEVLLLDEPFSQVDTLLKSRLRSDIKRLSTELGITIILVSHDPADGLSLADEIIILKQGNLLEQGSVANLYSNPTKVYTAQLLADANVLTTAEAEQLGIKAKKKFVIVYPDRVEIRSSWSSKEFRVIEAVFKGAFCELALERNGVSIRGQVSGDSEIKPGQRVQVVIKKYSETDE